MRRTWLGFMGLLSLGVGAVLLAGGPAQADCDDDDDGGCCCAAPQPCCAPVMTTTCCDPCGGNYTAWYGGHRHGFFGRHHAYRNGYYSGNACCTVGYTGGATVVSPGVAPSGAGQQPLPVAPPPPPNGGF